MDSSFSIVAYCGASVSPSSRAFATAAFKVDMVLALMAASMSVMHCCSCWMRDCFARALVMPGVPCR